MLVSSPVGAHTLRCFAVVNVCKDAYVADIGSASLQVHKVCGGNSPNASRELGHTLRSTTTSISFA
jgi:hypothetical protein